MCGVRPDDSEHTYIESQDYAVGTIYVAFEFAAKVLPLTDRARVRDYKAAVSITV